MTTKPEALRIAEWMEGKLFHSSKTIQDAAAELRRQHAEIERLQAERDALKAACDALQVALSGSLEIVRMSSAWKHISDSAKQAMESAISTATGAAA